MKTSLLLLALFAASPALAADRTTSVELILSEQTTLRDQLADPQGPFVGMPSVKRSQIAKHQGVVFTLLDGKSSTDELPEPETVLVFNSLEAINAAVNDREDERMICKREKRTGSNMVERKCRSVAQIKADRAQGQTNWGKGIYRPPPDMNR